MTTAVINGKTEQLQPLSGCARNVTPRDIRVHIVESDAPPGSVGKPGVAPFAPALSRLSRVTSTTPYRTASATSAFSSTASTPPEASSISGWRGSLERWGPRIASPSRCLSPPLAAIACACSLTTESTTMTFDDRTPGRS